MRKTDPRSPGIATFGTSKERNGHELVTTVSRVAVKMMFACFSFDLYQLHALRRVKVV